MPYKITMPFAFTGLQKTGSSYRDPSSWVVDGVTFIRDDADAARAYFERHPDVYAIEQVPAVDVEWAEDLAELQARNYHGNVTRPITLLSGGERNDRARAAVVTPAQVAAVVTAIEGA